jgi:hypothetical protein
MPTFKVIVLLGSHWPTPLATLPKYDESGQLGVMNACEQTDQAASFKADHVNENAG